MIGKRRANKENMIQITNEPFKMKNVQQWRAKREKEKKDQGVIKNEQWLGTQGETPEPRMSRDDWWNTSMSSSIIG